MPGVEFHPYLFSADPTNAFIKPNDIEATNVSILKDKTLRDDSLYQRQVEGVVIEDAVRNNLVKTSDHGIQFQNTLPSNPEPTPFRKEQQKEGFVTIEKTNILYIAAFLCLLYYLLAPPTA